MFQIFRTNLARPGELSEQNPKPTVDSLTNLVANIGTAKDLSSHSRFTADRRLSRNELDIMYRTSWLARKVIDVPVEEMTRAWRSFDETKAVRQRLAVEEQRLQLKSKVVKALRWARLYGGSALVLGIKGQSPEHPLILSQLGESSLSYLQVVDCHRRGC